MDAIEALPTRDVSDLLHQFLKRTNASYAQASAERLRAARQRLQLHEDGGMTWILRELQYATNMLAADLSALSWYHADGLLALELRCN